MRHVAIAIPFGNVLIMRKTFCNKRREIMSTITSILEGLEFADTIVLVSSNTKHLQRKTEYVSKNAEQIGLIINKIKNKKMWLAPSHVVITVNHKPLKDVENFTRI